MAEGSAVAGMVEVVAVEAVAEEGLAEEEVADAVAGGEDVDLPEVGAEGEEGAEE